VFLFSCEGGQRGPSEAGSAIADALKDAGAAAVWSFEDKLDAGEAMTSAESLLDQVKRGGSMLDAIKALAKGVSRFKGPRVYLRVQIDLLGQEMPRGSELTE
jgi:hypothetical protein